VFATAASTLATPTLIYLYRTLGWRTRQRDMLVLMDGCTATPHPIVETCAARSSNKKSRLGKVGLTNVPSTSSKGSEFYDTTS
jgi:hypothetical protein